MVIKNQGRIKDFDNQKWTQNYLGGVYLKIIIYSLGYIFLLTNMLIEHF